MNLIAYIDGSSLGNPGESGCGMVLTDEQGLVLEQVGWYLGHATNNTAEYMGLIKCLELARQFGAKSLTVYSDSELLVNQVHGTYRVKKDHLMVLHKRVQGVIRQYGFGFLIRHIPREQNHTADRLARLAIRMKSDVKENRNGSPGQGG